MHILFLSFSLKRKLVSLKNRKSETVLAIGLFAFTELISNLYQLYILFLSFLDL